MDWSVKGGQYVLPSSDFLFSHDRAPFTAGLRSSLDGLIDKYAPGLKLPCAMTEWNIDQAYPHADTPVNEHVSALSSIAADNIGQMVTGHSFDAQHYFALSDSFHDTGPESEHNPGPADLGLVARADSTVADNTPRPAWYAYATLKRALGDTLVSASTSNEGVTVYASTFSDGSVGLIVINRLREAVHLNVANLHAFGVSSDAEVRGWMVTSADPSASDPFHLRGSCWNGVCAADKIDGPFPINGITPYATSANNGAFKIPAASLVGLVVYH